MNYYEKKRKKSGLSKSDMAIELGLTYARYISIERGDVKMPSKLIDKFNEIVNRGKENELTNVENNIKADEFWEDVKQLREDGKYVLYTKMEEYNVKTVKELAPLLGYKSAGSIWNYLQDRNKAGNEFKKRLYNFFHDETNIQIPSTKPKVIAKPKTKMLEETQDLPEKTNDFYELVNAQPEEKDTTLTIKHVGVVERYKRELDDTLDLLEMYEKTTAQLKNRQIICEEVLKALKEFEEGEK